MKMKTIKIRTEVHRVLKLFCVERDLRIEDAASVIIEDWLRDRDYKIEHPTPSDQDIRKLVK